MDRLDNSTANLNNYAHFVAFADYENKPSYFHAFKLLELSTNSSVLAGKPATTEKMSNLYNQFNILPHRQISFFNTRHV
jgi:hypothetical protein